LGSGLHASKSKDCATPAASTEHYVTPRVRFSLSFPFVTRGSAAFYVVIVSAVTLLEEQFARPAVPAPSSTGGGASLPMPLMFFLRFASDRRDIGYSAFDVQLLRIVAQQSMVSFQTTWRQKSGNARLQAISGVFLRSAVSANDLI